MTLGLQWRLMVICFLGQLHLVLPKEIDSCILPMISLPVPCHVTACFVVKLDVKYVNGDSE